MNLYRLDFANGQPVADVFGPVLLRESARATARASAEAAAANLDVTVSRISGAGSLRAMRRVSPDGRVTRLTNR